MDLEDQDAPDDNKGKVLYMFCRTKLLFTFVRTTLTGIGLGGRKAKFERREEPKTRGLVENVGSVTAGFIRVVQQWLPAKRQASGEKQVLVFHFYINKSV